jgi:Putative transposase/Transposase zinc-binding domain
MTKYGSVALPGHKKALNAILRCRTPESDELYVRCHDCEHSEWRPLSCVNRHCPRYQNYLTSLWIDKQQEQLLPVPYFMSTFTLPAELRQWAWSHQKIAYSILFKCAGSTLKDFGMNSKNLRAEIGMTMVLHSNNRRLDYHPHLHAVVTGGGIDRRRLCWMQGKEKFLFNEFALAKVFRACFLDEMRAASITLPRVPKKWMVVCEYVGKGITALKYLSRHLYRGEISETNIVSNHNGEITFQYIKSKSEETKFRTLKGFSASHLTACPAQGVQEGPRLWASPR